MKGFGTLLPVAGWAAYSVPKLMLSKDSSATGAAPRFRLDYRILFPVLFLIFFIAQCAWFLRTQSLTYDEPVHIAEGLDAWRNGRFQQYNDHPPLARLWCALPLLDKKWQIEVQALPHGFRIDRIAPDPVSLAWRARAMNIVLGVMLGVLLWSSAARFFSVAAANFALALFAFSPSLIAHFSLATTDGAATLLIFATAWQVVLWRHDTGWKSVLLSGLVFGLLLLAKFSTVPMFIMALGWTLVLTGKQVSLRPRSWNWAKTTAVLTVATVIVWAGYFFHVSHLSIRNGELTVQHPHWSAQYVKPIRSRLHLTMAIPAGEFVAGFRDVALHNAHGQPAFFLGQVSPTGGWKLYYPIVILLKWPSLVLVLAATGIVLLARFRPWEPDLWIVASFPAVYFGLAIFAHFNLGERHVLPLYPFALLFAAAVWESGARVRGTRMILIGLVILNAADALRAAPDYLAYFNAAVPQATSYRLLSDSNLDWGQGLLALRKYQQDHPQEQLSLAYFGSVDPAVYGIQARALPEDEHATGTVVVSATQLSGQYLNNASAYHWLLRYQPAEMLDRSMYVFQVPH